MLCCCLVLQDAPAPAASPAIRPHEAAEALPTSMAAGSSDAQQPPLEDVPQPATLWPVECIADFTGDTCTHVSGNVRA